jgi:hypothetical protein
VEDLKGKDLTLDWAKSGLDKPRIGQGPPIFIIYLEPCPLITY